MDNIIIRELKASEWEEAMQLAWQTFMKFEASDYTPEGVKSFRDFVKGENLKELFLKGDYPAWGAFDNGICIGVISMRNKSHISLLFVDGDYHHRGIASELINTLFDHAENIFGQREVTVNSAPYARGFYHKIGFVDLDGEKTVDGIRYTPMVIDLKERS